MIYDLTVGKVQREKLHVRRQGSGWWCGRAKSSSSIMGSEQAMPKIEKSRCSNINTLFRDGGKKKRRQRIWKWMLQVGTKDVMSAWWV